MKKRQFQYIFYLLIGFIIFNILWYLLAKLIMMNALPDPIKVYMSYQKAVENGLAGHIAVSLTRIGAGLAISLVIAMIAGIAMGYSRTINRLMAPLLYLSYPVPKLALLPVIMIFFGIGDLSKVIMIVVIIVFQLIVSIRDAVADIPEENYDVLVSLKATAWDKISNITLPAAVPAVFSSLRISIGTAISVLIVTETYGTNRGLGFYIIDCWMRADYVHMYFAIIVLSLIGFIVFLALDIAQNYLCRWKMN